MSDRFRWMGIPKDSGWWLVIVFLGLMMFGCCRPKFLTAGQIPPRHRTAPKEEVAE